MFSRNVQSVRLWLVISVLVIVQSLQVNASVVGLQSGSDTIRQELFHGLGESGEGGALSGLNYPQALWVNPLTGAEMLVLTDRECLVFRKEPTTSSWALYDTLPLTGGKQTLRLVVSPDGQWLYISQSDGLIEVFSKQGGDNWESIHQVQKDELLGVTALAMTPDGQFLFAVSPETSALTLFRRLISGDLRHIKTLSASGDDPIAGLKGAHDLAISPDSTLLAVSGKHSNAVTFFQRTPEGGEWLYDQTVQHQAMDALMKHFLGPAGLKFSEDGRLLYVALNQANALVTLKRSSDTGLWDSYQWVMDSDHKGTVDADSIPVIFVENLKAPEHLWFEPAEGQQLGNLLVGTPKGIHFFYRSVIGLLQHDTFKAGSDYEKPDLEEVADLSWSADNSEFYYIGKRRHRVNAIVRQSATTMPPSMPPSTVPTESSSEPTASSSATANTMPVFLLYLPLIMRRILFETL